jgi:glucose-1-phosphate adenylyltransferase
VRIGNNVKIVGDVDMPDSETEQYCVRDGIVIIKKGAIILANTQVVLNAG